jgi:DNA helicase HerA-like ATPase
MTERSQEDPIGAELDTDSPVANEGNPEAVEQEINPVLPADQQAAADAIQADLIELGFVAFDDGGASNDTSSAMVSEQYRRDFRRDIYVGIQDNEQRKEFLGRIVEGPFHAPHEVTADSAITRTTILHPDRTRFRPTYYAYGSIEIIGEIRPGERVAPSATRPRPYSKLYIFPPNRLREMLGITGDFYLGHLMGYDAVEVHTDIANKNFLPRNVGIFGTIGSGKSNTTQVLIEESLDADWAVVVIDVEGEYVRMDEDTVDASMIRILRETHGLQPRGVRDLRVYVPSSGGSDAAQPIPFKVPVSGLDHGVVADILELTEAQVRMFGNLAEAAARQGRARPSRAGVLAPPSPLAPVRPYTLQDLIDGLTDNQPGVFPLLPNIQPHERLTAWTLRSKLRQLARSGMVDSAQTAAIPELPVNDLLVAGRLSVLDVSETDDHSRNLAIAYVLDALFQKVLDHAVGIPMPNGVARPKLLVIIEEVHTFVSRASAAKMRSVLDSLQIISRRGRKRWMALALVSQQPGHVPDELFELANTRFVHQLKSASNLAPVRATTGGVHEALWSTVPSLGSGQCLVTGAVFRNPLFVDMRPAQSRRLLSGD